MAALTLSQVKNDMMAQRTGAIAGTAMLAISCSRLDVGLQTSFTTAQTRYWKRSQRSVKSRPLCERAILMTATQQCTGSTRTARPIPAIHMRTLDQPPAFFTALNLQNQKEMAASTPPSSRSTSCVTSANWSHPKAAQFSIPSLDQVLPEKLQLTKDSMPS